MGGSWLSLRNKTKYLFYYGIFPYFALYFTIQYFIKKSEFDFLTRIDTFIPFVPEFIWIYHTLFPAIILLTVFIIQKKTLYWDTLTAYVIAIGVLAIFYVVFPSFYPRHELMVTNLSEWLVHATWQIDAAHNTFPSSHVTFSWLLFCFFTKSSLAANKKWTVPLVFTWASMVSFSTLFLKQHYLLDVFSGVLLAVLCFYFVSLLPNRTVVI